MKRFIGMLFVLLFALPLAAAETPESCQLCAGVVLSAPPLLADAPALLFVDASALDQAAVAVDQLSTAQKTKTIVVVRAALGADTSIATLEESLTRIIEWGSARGPFASIGLAADELPVDLHAYALKRFAVIAEGHRVSDTVIFPARDVAQLEALYKTGAQAYFDQVLSPSAEVSQWIVQNDPVKRIAVVTEAKHANALYDAARELSTGATFAFLSDQQFAPAAALFNREMGGDYAPDTTSDIRLLDTAGAERSERPIAFVRGKDLRTLVVTPGDATGASIVSLPEGDFSKPELIAPTRRGTITDTGAKNRRFLIGMRAMAEPYMIALERPPLDPSHVTKETIDVATERGISVEEIIRRHQAYHAFQESIAPQYIARNDTKLRFAAGAGEQIEATISGEHFIDPAGISDWVWSDFYVNGVRWKYGRIPELPLIQPEKVSQLPLDIHLTNDYRYQLAGQAAVDGYDTWEVRFEPPPNAPLELPLYRGTVWIDKRTSARIRISMIQLNLSGEVLSNDESVFFQPFDRESGRPVDAAAVRTLDAKQIIWLPLRVSAQQSLSTAGRTTAVLRTTDFTNFRLRPAEFAALHEQAARSDARMVRETDHGLRYLERNGRGERVVKEGFDASRLFAVGGIHHDEGLEYPVVPLGGIDYFNFNLAERGIQANVFFAGVVLAVNATDPSFMGTRTNLGADFFGMAIATENSIYRDGVKVEDETVKTLPMLFATRVGHPFLTFGKADLTLAVSHTSFQRAEDTASNFVVPSDTFTINPGVDVSYARKGWSFGAAYEQGLRTEWEPWGFDGSEYNGDDDHYSRWNASLGKSFYLPKFQRIGIEVNYFDGSQLDRFSKYELGFFGSQRVRGFQSGSVQAESMALGHLSYGFVISDQLRLEAFYDHALIDNEASGYNGEPFQGVGIAGQLIGPFGTLMRIDIGKSIGRNAQDDFVADVMFLKLFD